LNRADTLGRINRLKHPKKRNSKAKITNSRPLEGENSRRSSNKGRRQYSTLNPENKQATINLSPTGVGSRSSESRISGSKGMSQRQKAMENNPLLQKLQRHDTMSNVLNNNSKGTKPKRKSSRSKFLQSSGKSPRERKLVRRDSKPTSQDNKAGRQRNPRRKSVSLKVLEDTIGKSHKMATLVRHDTFQNVFAGDDSSAGTSTSSSDNGSLTSGKGGIKKPRPPGKLRRQDTFGAINKVKGKKGRRGEKKTPKSIFLKS